MGEFARFNGDEVKIGTCENLYYLRADQRRLVRAVEGNLDPVRDAGRVRFRFPWPDEDGIAPGGFHDRGYDRGVAIDGLTIPADADHCIVQFVAHAGYNVCLPCPESLPEGGRGIDFHGHTVRRNGFPGRVLLCQQRLLPDGRLVPVFRCGGCGARWRLEDAAEIETAVVAARRMADARKDGAAGWWHTVADRIAGAPCVTAHETATA